MEQIKFLKYKITNQTLTIHLKDRKNNVCVWTIPLKKPINGHINKIRYLLRRSLYDLAYEFTDDPTERNVIMDLLWFILHDDVSRYVWVYDGFLDVLNEKYNC